MGQLGGTRLELNPSTPDLTCDVGDKRRHTISRNVWIFSSWWLSGPVKTPGPHLCRLLTVALGKGIKLLSLPHIHLPPTITPIEPGSLGEPHWYSLHISIPQPQPSPLETLFHYIYYAFGITELVNVQCAHVCVGVGELRCFLLCIHGGDKPVVKRVLKRV